MLNVGDRVRLTWHDGETRDDGVISRLNPDDFAPGSVEVTFADEPEDPYVYELGDGCTTMYFEVNNMTVPVLIEPV